MSAPWFYQSVLPKAGESAALSHDEAKHAVGARRLRDGDEVCLFDGTGAVAHGTIAGATGQTLSVNVARMQTIAPLRPAITVASAVPKGDRMSALLSQIAQLGAAAFVPLECARSVAGARRWLAGRGERIIIEACKQSHNPHVPALHQPCTPAALAQRAEHLWIADPSGRPVRDIVQQASNLDQLTIAIGPEGGFADRERAAMSEHGATTVRLGRNILRIETAAVALLAHLRLATSA